MFTYILVLFAVILLYLLTYDGEKAQSKGILLGMMLFLGLFVGISDMLGGYDRYIYCELFDVLCDSKAENVPLHETELFMLYPSEFGYDTLNYIISFVTHNRYIFILIC